MFKTEDFDRLTRNFEEAHIALAGLQDELGSITFSPGDPASIEMAMRNIDAIIDRRLRAYLSNPMLLPIADQLKDRYHDAIGERAAAWRSSSAPATTR
ncbi:hypothetical protein [Polymorphobacter megasporae]|uniref:hypothetical protein n=1 Tax=Glacieibacterium megasporae TaxID=2835787 RepID=UPI001C1DED63|nr:hypothetical protein [Polymorphobacter megasporae]UAJ11038.1 hypothetical protein KTC28_04810 [Polymorphobacter megasporae]